MAKRKLPSLTDLNHPQPHKKRAPVRKTVTGKVVYKRRRHFFTRKDLARVFRHILQYNNGSRENIVETFFEFIELIDTLVLEYANILGASVPQAAIDSITHLFSEIFLQDTLKKNEKKKE